MWGVPADDECFSHINSSQWMWYYYNYLEDKHSEFTNERDLVEYQVSFFEPKIIKELLEERKERESKETEEKDFGKQVENTFGRGIGLGDTLKIKSNMNNIDDVAGMLQTADIITSTQRKSKDPTLYNFRHWLEFNLE